VGLGGYLAWTAAAREIRNRTGKHVKILPVEQHGNFIKIIYSEIFENCDHFLSSSKLPTENSLLFPLVLNNPDANYCKQDLPNRAIHRSDKHIIEQYCEVYGIQEPELKCDLKIPAPIDTKMRVLLSQILEGDDFIVIEPSSKDSYTKNRAYPFEKWQLIVRELNKRIKIIQVGVPGTPVLEGVIDLTGKTSFLEAASIIGLSKLFLSSEGGLVHAATAVDTKSIVVITGYQTEKMVAYPQNININIANHGPCGLKSRCNQCEKDSVEHDYNVIVQAALAELNLS